MKAFDPAVPFYGLPPPQLSSVSIGKSAGNISRTMSNLAQNRSFDYEGYAYEFSRPEDLRQEDNQTPQFDDSFIALPDSIVHQATAQKLFHNGLVGDSYENSYQHQDYYYNDHENAHLPGFHSEPQRDAQFSRAYHGCPTHDVSGLKFHQPYDQTDSEGNYDRISQLLSTSVANLHKLPNDFNEDSVEGKCIGEGYLFEKILHEAKNSGSYLGRSKNSNLMEKDAAHIFETNVGHFSSGYNAPGIDNLIQSLLQTEIQKQPVQNTTKTVETEENYNHFPYCWSYGEQLKVELLQAISSLTAHIGRLEIQVEHLTHQVQDMSNKLSDENKLKAPILDQSGDSKAAFEESKITSTAVETPESKLFIETEASYQKLDESASDWEII
ncbi:uncharacterized protein LOC110101722 isoform X2 [Dendrobium catenatum]|uniref:uncharacterized protein LOC110101722 isoform X2 n=1 Tax=Dendrobium catenatum TaxID=906689 RepID=UPI0009F2884A|nr:uncharacterized protein LOC110101722 isoform X2 [Dendrobium catenatum]